MQTAVVTGFLLLSPLAAGAQTDRVTAYLEEINAVLREHGSDATPPVVSVSGDTIVVTRPNGSSNSPLQLRVAAADAQSESRRAPAAAQPRGGVRTWRVSLVCREDRLCVQVRARDGTPRESRRRINLDVWADEGAEKLLGDALGRLIFWMRVQGVVEWGVGSGPIHPA